MNFNLKASTLVKFNKTVFIHIGYGKTGTSSIQDMMFRNRNFFLKKGLLYPEIGLWMSSHHKLTQIPHQKNYVPYIGDNLRKIREAFVYGNCNKLLISSENLCFSQRELIEMYANVFGSLDVRVVMYVRRQDYLVPSVYLEWVKNGWDYKGNIADYFAFSKIAYDFLTRLSDWEELFGQQNIRVRLYDDRIIKDVCQDFLACIGMSEFMGQLKFYRSNPSLSPVFVDIVRAIDQMELAKDNRALLVSKLVESSAFVKGVTNKYLIDDDLRHLIYQTYKQSNIELAGRYLTDKESECFLYWGKE